VASQVLSYFIRNPQAVDSLEGITRWRLLDEAIHQRVKATHEALLWLVERGVLRQVQQGPGVEPVFSLNPDRKEEAERLLAELKPGREPNP
jgi:hypothetical protein